MPDTLNRLLQSLEHPELKVIDLSLDRMRRALAAVGNPQLKLPPVIHLAGTNGKGSTLATLRAIYEAAGYKVHAYTSPHLVHVRERFYCAGEYLSDEELISRLEAVKALAKECPITFFEATTLMAFQLFAEIPADVVLLETGLGGQFDATNVVPKPALTIITPIGLDHQAFLGETLAEIAYEKACIMKAGAPCLSAPQAPSAANVLQSKASELGCELDMLQEQDYKMQEEKLNVRGALCQKPNLVGAHQWMNAAVAVSAVKRLQKVLPVSVEDQNKGLRKIHWPARLQPMTEGKYADIAASYGAELWLDGGHNEAAAERIAEWLAERHRKSYLICAMTKNHDVKGFLSVLAEHVEGVVPAEIREEPLSHPASVIGDAACELALCVIEGDTPNIPLEEKLHQLGKHATLEGSDILLVGSLYFAGKVLANTA